MPEIITPTVEDAVQAEKHDGAPTPNDAAKAAEEKKAESSFKPVDSQEALDRIVQERLARERAKYEGFDEYKAAAEKLKSLEDSQKSDIQREVEAREAAERVAAERQAEIEARDARIAEFELNQLKAQVAADKKLPAAAVARLQGTTRQELEADAEVLAELFKPEPGVNLSTRPSQVGGDVRKTSEAAAFDAAEFAESFLGAKFGI